MMFYFPDTYQGKENSPTRFWVISDTSYLLPDGRELTMGFTTDTTLSHVLKHGRVVDQIVTKPMRVGRAVFFEHGDVPRVGGDSPLVEGTDEYLAAEQLTAEMKTPLPVSSLIYGHQYLTSDLKTIVWLGEMNRKSLRNKNGTLTVVNEIITCYSQYKEIHFVEKDTDVRAFRSLGEATPGSHPFGTIKNGGLVNDLVTKDKIPDTFTLTMVPDDFCVTRVIDDMLCVPKNHSANEYYVLDDTLRYRKTIKTTKKGQGVDLILNFGIYGMDVYDRELLKYCQEAEKALTGR